MPGDHADKSLEIGGEETPEQYVAKLVDVFREVRRVLRDDGTLWLNIGDSYAAGSHAGTGEPYRRTTSGKLMPPQMRAPITGDLKPKDLIGIPWMVAFALRADGWWLRQELIWHKLAPMPESVTDRCTKAHEQVFLLAKSATYYYDAEAIAEPSAYPGDTRHLRTDNKKLHEPLSMDNGSRARTGNPTGETRNKRSVWTLGPESYSGAHYATMPTKLVEPCVLAGSSQRGCCEKCLAPWERLVEEERSNYKTSHYANTAANGAVSGGVGKNFPDTTRTTTGWQPTCTCAADIQPCTVLDPFFGSGTVGAVALKHGRNFIGIDLDERNLTLAHKRIAEMQPLLLELT